MKINTLFFYMMIAAAAVLSACTSESKPTPLFKDTDLIELNVGTSPTIAYVLPSSKCKYVVVGIFSASPLVDPATNQLDATTPIVYGTRTNLPGFVVTAQPWSQLYPYSAAAYDFDDTAYAAISGTYYVAVWAYDSNYNLIASSPASDAIGR